MHAVSDRGWMLPISLVHNSTVFLYHVLWAWYKGLNVASCMKQFNAQQKQPVSSALKSSPLGKTALYTAYVSRILRSSWVSSVQGQISYSVNLDKPLFQVENPLHQQYPSFSASPRWLGPALLPLTPLVLLMKIYSKANRDVWLPFRYMLRCLV